LAHRRYLLFISRHRVEERHRCLVLDHGHRLDGVDPNTPARMPEAFGEDWNGRRPDVDELSDGPELLLAIQQRDQGFRPLRLLLGQSERSRTRPNYQGQAKRKDDTQRGAVCHLMIVDLSPPSGMVPVPPSMLVNRMLSKYTTPAPRLQRPIPPFLYVASSQPSSRAERNRLLRNASRTGPRIDSRKVCHTPGFVSTCCSWSVRGWPLTTLSRRTRFSCGLSQI